MNCEVDIGRLMKRIGELSQVGRLAGGGVSRIALTEEDKQGRDLICQWMKALGMEVQTDRIGNMVGLLGDIQARPPIMMGSHIDTVKTGGNYDGSLGVLAGLEVVQRLQELDLAGKTPIAVGVFTNEEGVRYMPDMMGSLVYAGGLDTEEALATQGTDGSILGNELERIGYAGHVHPGTVIPQCFLELHIEQGPVLERAGIDIGIVESVQGISWTELVVQGTSNHAGTTPMSMRHDAGYVATSIACHVREIAGNIGGSQVGTVGSISFSPNLVNVIPYRASLTVDFRNTDEQLLQRSERELGEFVKKVQAEEGVNVTSRQLVRFSPVAFDKDMVDTVEKVAVDLGYTSLRMPSGAGHDAQMLARICPAAMIFVPSQAGLSHNVKEYTSPEDIERGANVLLNSVLKLAAVS